MLVRPRSGRIVAGVCAGLADRFGVSRTLMRLVFAVLVLAVGMSLLVYPVLWIIMPAEGSPRDVRPTTR
ncbi:PspC domain-containing protein [Pseudokineococcus sp. 1T1Z-3]|uniref:PspC domain-containing protein n=1 Tax=Pseudokineococcus sp. 1T1Z-3 TaxID=3132745 RepID=UPI0030950F7C